MRTNYCITHEITTILKPGQGEDCLIVFCPPPAELDKDGWEWTMSLPVPSDEEMALMDESADAMWFDLMEDTL